MKRWTNNGWKKQKNAEVRPIDWIESAIQKWVKLIKNMDHQQTGEEESKTGLEEFGENNDGFKLITRQNDACRWVIAKNILQRQ